MIRTLGAVAIGLAVGCFSEPSAAVMFSCDPGGDDACPDGYTCEADGCCHREGSDVEEHLGECKLAGTATGAPDGSGSPSDPGATGTATSGTTGSGTSPGTTSASGSDGSGTTTAGDSSSSG